VQCILQQPPSRPCSTCLHSLASAQLSAAARRQRPRRQKPGGAACLAPFARAVVVMCSMRLSERAAHAAGSRGPLSLVFRAPSLGPRAPKLLQARAERTGARRSRTTACRAPSYHARATDASGKLLTGQAATRRGCPVIHSAWTAACIQALPTLQASYPPRQETRAGQASRSTRRMHAHVLGHAPATPSPGGDPPPHTLAISCMSQYVSRCCTLANAALATRSHPRDLPSCCDNDCLQPISTSCNTLPF
jgi:hypothetical protein